MTTSYYNPNDDNIIFIQSRVEMNQRKVDEYTELMLEDFPFDPAQAITDGHNIYIWDGSHRGEAAKAAGKLLFVSVKPGTEADARWLALTANQKHGLERSPADKRHVVSHALLHPNGATMSDREIARHCGVTHPTVGKVRAELEVTGKITSQTVRTGGDGRVIDTSGIGGRMKQVLDEVGETLAELTQPAPNPDTAELHKQLGRALHQMAGADTRWETRRWTGQDNNELLESIRYEFTNSGGFSGPGDSGYRSKGGTNPKFWLGCTYDDRPPTLQGAALQDVVRELLTIPFPGEQLPAPPVGDPTNVWSPSEKAIKRAEAQKSIAPPDPAELQSANKEFEQKRIAEIEADALTSALIPALAARLHLGDMAAWGALAYLVVKDEHKRTKLDAELCHAVALTVVTAVGKGGQGLPDTAPADARARLHGWLEPWGLAELLPEATEAAEIV